MIEKRFQRPTIANGDDTPILYCNQHSYYCQKVLLACYEKGIKFRKHEIDVINDEQFTDWFLEFNPRGELPVLQHGLLVVPGSIRILDYLEEKFPTQHSLRLPANNNSTIASFRQMLDKLPIGLITLGSFRHSHLTGWPKFPYILPVRQTILARNESLCERLRSYANQSPTYREVLLKKAEFHERKLAVITSPAYFADLLDTLDGFLQQVEHTLDQVDLENGWISGNVYTIIDIGLGALLYRLYVLGLEDRFWTGGKKPAIEKYFHKTIARESFLQTLPSKVALLKTAWTNTPPLYIAGLAAVSSLLVSSTLLRR